MVVPVSSQREALGEDAVYTSVESLLSLRFYAQNLSLKPQKRSSAIIDGGARSRYRGRGMEFAEVRPYQAGDDIRSIDWRVTARTQQPYTKLFQEEKERPVLLLVDQRPSMFFGSRRVFKSVAAAQIAATIAWAAQQNNDRIGALLIGEKSETDLRARQGKRAVLTLIQKLVEANTQLRSPVAANRNARPLAAYIEELRHVARPGSAIFIISDFMDFDQHGAGRLTLLARHTDTRLIHLYDPLELSLPGKAPLSLSNGRDFLRIPVASQISDKMRMLFSQRQEHLRQTAQQIQATYAAVDAGRDLQDVLQEIFMPQRRGISASSMASARR